jgi:hypothetical protein
VPPILIVLAAVGVGLIAIGLRPGGWEIDTLEFETRPPTAEPPKRRATVSSEPRVAISRGWWRDLFFPSIGQPQ